MKHSQLTLGVFLCLFGLPAFSATGSLLSLYGVPRANVVYVSGSSSLTGSGKIGGSFDLSSGPLISAVAASCSGGTQNIRTFVLDKNARRPGHGGISPKKPGSFSEGYVVVCTTSSVDGQFYQPFAVVKREINGSFDGVGPVIAQTPLLVWADIENCSDTEFACGIDWVTPRIPHLGFSDVETNIWIGSNNTGASSIPVPTNTGSTVFNGGFAGQGFGVMVSESLYRAMQAKQINEGRLPADCSSVIPATAAGVASLDSGFLAGKCQPSIRKEEYAAVIDGGNFAYVNNGALSGDSNVINLCRRVETSGTQAFSNVYFLNNPCGNSNPTHGFKSPKKVDEFSETAVTWKVIGVDAITGNYDDFGGVFGLFEGSSTGDARNCVIRRNGGKNPNNVADSLGTYAIGLISLSNRPSTSFQNSGWRFIKLDGVSPDAYQVLLGSAEDVANGGAADGWAQDASQRINVVNGLYGASAELEMLWPAATPFGGFIGTLSSAFSEPHKMDAVGIFRTPIFDHIHHASSPTRVHKGVRAGNSCAPITLVE